MDHSLLLGNYFTSLGKKSYLVLGRGVPEGPTAYVLTAEDNGANWLWNSVTGERFGTAENFCPLTAVSAVVNEQNVWGNIQPADRPGRIRLDLQSIPKYTELQEILRWAVLTPNIRRNRLLKMVENFDLPAQEKFSEKLRASCL